MKSQIVIFIFFALFSINLSGQDEGCSQMGHEAYLEKIDPNYSALSSRAVKVNSKNLKSNRSNFQEDIPMSIYILTLDDGSLGISECEVITAIDELNEHYISTGFHFYISNIKYINNSSRFNLTTYSKANSLYAEHHTTDAVNVYFVNYAVGSCGFANFPWSSNKYMVLKNTCATNTSTFAHEMGHYLGLLHTHDTNNGEELVERVNCENTGDLLCGTEADPKLSGKVNSSCQYTGTDVDAQGNRYHPNANNLMSYSRKTCRNQFSSDQVSRMIYYYETSRAAELGNLSDNDGLSCPCIDLDQDGFCSGNDFNDQDPCITLSSTPICGNCTTVSYESFEESDWGIWNDGGSDCQLVNSSYATDGSYTARLRDDSGIGSSMYTNTLDFEGTESVTITFSYNTLSMEPGEHFDLSVSSDGGATFTTLLSLVSGVDFGDRQEYQNTVQIPTQLLSRTTVIRFECIASANFDMVFLDEIQIEACSTGSTPDSLQTDEEESVVLQSKVQNADIEEIEEKEYMVNVYPNPFNEGVQVQFNSEDEIPNSVSIISMQGKLIREIKNVEESNQGLYIDLSDSMEQGLLILMVQYPSGHRLSKKIYRSIQ